MNDDAFLLISNILQIGFLVSLVVAAIAIRNAVRRRHAERLRREQQEMVTKLAPREDL